MKATDFLSVIPAELHQFALRVLDPVPAMRGVLISHSLSDRVFHYRVFVVQRLTQYYQGQTNFESTLCEEAEMQGEILESVRAVELKTPIDAEDFRRLTYYHKNSTLLFEEFKLFALSVEGQAGYHSRQSLTDQLISPAMDSRTA